MSVLQHSLDQCLRVDVRAFYLGHSKIINPSSLDHHIITSNIPFCTGSLGALPVRLLLPPTLLIGALNYFLPKTTHNVNAYLTGLERAHFPAVAEQHEAANQALRDAVKGVRRLIHLVITYCLIDLLIYS